jgi:hypothetical protein
MSNEIQKLAEAETAQALMHQELDKVSGELERLDLNSDDLDKTVDAQIRLTAKRDILARRLELAQGAVEVLRGDVLIQKEKELQTQVTEVSARLEAAKKQAHSEIMKMIGGGGGLQPHQTGIINAMVNLCRDVSPLLAEVEFLTCRHREAEAGCRNVAIKRAQAESIERAKLQSEVFAGNV